MRFGIGFPFAQTMLATCHPQLKTLLRDHANRLVVEQVIDETLRVI
jgi:cytochrome P450